MGGDRGTPKTVLLGGLMAVGTAIVITILVRLSPTWWAPEAMKPDDSAGFAGIPRTLKAAPPGRRRRVSPRSGPPLDPRGAIFSAAVPTLRDALSAEKKAVAGIRRGGT